MHDYPIGKLTELLGAGKEKGWNEYAYPTRMWPLMGMGRS
jgi:hypothetical protein